MTWRSKITVVDVHSGEELTQKHIRQGHYVIIKKTIKHTKTNEYYGTRHIRWECQKNPQTKIF